MRGRTPLRLCVGAVASALLSTAPAAAAVEDAAPEVVLRLKAVFHERYPDVPVYEIHRSPLPGIYEVMSGGTLFYTNDNGSLALVGQLVDTQSKEDLTAKRLAELDSVAFSTLPVDLAIKVVRGNGKHKLAVFADPLCPFCHELETALDQLSDSTVYVFLYPLEGLHPGATQLAQSIWCARDRAAAWNAWMSRQENPTETACAQPGSLEAVQALGERLHVSSTPTLILSDGQRLRGLPHKERLEQLLSKSD